MDPQQQMQQGNRDLVLPPGTYAYVLDTTKGLVSVYVGPKAGTLTTSEKLVVWTGKRFSVINDQNEAIKSFVKAGEGQYVVLTDPARGEEEHFPKSETIAPATGLDVGKRIVIPGPATFPLWPGQTAQVIDGHHLNLNQYLVVQVYEPDAAQANMERQIAAPAGEEGPAAPEKRAFTMGERIVIRGTDVSFYVPPTGIEVLPETTGGKPAFVREAATLEQLEYCVLRDENGRKRYERGPAVVFPEPTETFVTEKNSRKFRAIELNEQSGLYIKVIAPYTEDGEDHEEGEELFLTGKDTPIYFPRPEQSVIHYGEQRKHHAVAVPSGEGRYVLDRTTGEVDLVQGPSMFLPDPRTQVVVRRVLDAKAVQMMFPGNAEAAAINAAWRSERELAGEEFLPMAQASTGESGSLASSYAATTRFAGDKMRRGTEYTPPRTITLDTKYQGAVSVSVWPGYAVLVMDKTGSRRVEVGPVNILLRYDETLMALSLSTGRPKTPADPYKTVYLRTINNSVGDRVVVETRDLVPVTIDLSLRVNFEGEDPTRWFDVEDYIALLTDHCRSRLRNAAKRFGIEEFYTRTIDIVRDTLLGASEDGKRAGLTFDENGMRLYDVEVTASSIQHGSVAELMTGSTIRAIQGAIELSEAEETALRESRLEALRRRAIEEREVTAEAQSEANLAAIARERDAALKTQEVEAARRAIEQAEFDAVIGQTRATNEVALARTAEEVKQLVERTKAVSPSLVTAIQNFGDQRFVDTLVEALGPAALAAGVSSVDILHQAFKGTPFESITTALSQRPFALENGAPAGEPIPK